MKDARREKRLEQISDAAEAVQARAEDAVRNHQAARAEGAAQAAARSARPLEMEFANANPAHGAVGGATHDEALLEGFVDHADEAVYAAAVARFERDMRAHTSCPPGNLGVA